MILLKNKYLLINQRVKVYIKAKELTDWDYLMQVSSIREALYPNLYRMLKENLEIETTLTSLYRQKVDILSLRLQHQTKQKWVMISFLGTLLVLQSLIIMLMMSKIMPEQISNMFLNMNLQKVMATLPDMKVNTLTTILTKKCLGALTMKMIL